MTPELDLTADKVRDVLGGEKKRGPGRPKRNPDDPPPARKRSHDTRKPKGDVTLEGRIEGLFDRIGAVLLNRGDTELGEAIREDKTAMAGGIVSLTRGFRALRPPLIFLLGVIEPLLAFGRVFSILGRRAGERIARIREERAQALAEYQAASEPSESWQPEPEPAEPATPEAFRVG